MFIYFPSAGDMNATLSGIEGKYTQQANRTDAFKTIAWYQMYDAKKKIKVNSIATGKWLKKFSSKPQKWKTNPLDAFYRSKATADALNAKAMPKYGKAKAAEMASFTKAQEAEKLAEASNFGDESLNAQASHR